MQEPKFEIVGTDTPVIKVTGDDVPEIATEEQQPVLAPPKPPRYCVIVGEYNKSNHPAYKPTLLYRNLKHKMAYEKQVTLYSACKCGSGKKTKFCCGIEQVKS